jgi:glycosyltransferase involved in cell wall biosynthesis
MKLIHTLNSKQLINHKEPIHICMVTSVIEVPNSSGLGSGGSTHVFEVLKGLRNNDIDINIFCARGINQQFKTYKQGLKIYRIFKWKKKFLKKSIVVNLLNEHSNKSKFLKSFKLAYKFFRDFFFTIKIIVLNFNKKPKVVYERLSNSTLSGSLYSILMRIPLIVEVNDLSYSSLSLHYAKFIITPSLKAIPKRFQKKCVLLPWGVDLEHFKPNTSSAYPVLFKTNLNEKIVILFTGSFLSWHGLYELVDAAATITKNFKSVIFLIVGDGPEKSNIESYVKLKKLTSFFIFTGFVSYEDLPRYMASADIGIAPYNSQLSGKRAEIAVPLKVLEYMSMSLPVVVSESGNFQNLIVSGINGFVYPTDNVFEMISAIQKLITNKILRYKLGRSARNKVASNFSWQSHCDKITSIISTASE